MQESDGEAVDVLPEARKPQVQALTGKEGRVSFLLAVYAFWLFLGFFGMHRIYAGKTRSGGAMLSLCLAGWFLVLSGGVGVLAGWLFAPAGSGEAGVVGLAGWGLGVGVAMVARRRGVGRDVAAIGLLATLARSLCRLRAWGWSSVGDEGPWRSEPLDGACGMLAKKRVL